MFKLHTCPNQVTCQTQVSRQIQFKSNAQVSYQVHATTLDTIPEDIVLKGATQSHVSDHPLNLNPDSQWQSFFKDNEVLLQVHQGLLGNG
jgi:hypothetical protein